MSFVNVPYDDDTLQQINASVDLYEYVSRSLSMEKRGKDYFAHCPLHTDRTPSFSITPSKNSYYCFSCGRAGGIIGYLIDFEGLPFDAAVDKAASLADMDLSKICKSATMSFLKKVRSSRLNKAEPYVHELIPESEYTKYKKCYPEEWLSEGISQEAMDLFEVRVDEGNNRIVYPVRDIDGNLINIKARTRYSNYKELRIPKYINYYQIGVMDYLQGLNITYKDIKDKNELILFESVKSVMKAYGWGFCNCASAEKHTLTQEQLELIVRLGVNVVFAYDSDVDYKKSSVWESIYKLKSIVNVHLIDDKLQILGGAESKNSPADLGKDIWEALYNNKRKVV